MNDTQQATPCTCMTCPGASCGCGCQNVPSQVAAQATTQATILAGCSCGAQCPCGPGCSCAKS